MCIQCMYAACNYSKMRKYQTYIVGLNALLSMLLCKANDICNTPQVKC
jgi:hypothetical protein